MIFIWFAASLLATAGAFGFWWLFMAATIYALGPFVAAIAAVAIIIATRR